jgi:hypothetical protein
MPDQTPLHQITYPLGTDRADIRVLETMAGDVDRELGLLDDLNDAAQAPLITPAAGIWTPTFAGGWVIGNATVKAEYYTLSSLVTCRFVITAVAGSTTVWGTSYPTFTLPFPSYSASSSICRHSVSGVRYILVLSLAAGSNLATVSSGAALGQGVGKYPAYQSTGTSAWASGNNMYGTFSYRRV